MNRVSLLNQAGAIRSVFPASEIKRKGEKELTWIHTITPSALSGTYKVKLHFTEKEGVKFYVLEPKLQLAPGETKLKHVYSTSKQQLCLYSPEGKEWNKGMLLVKTIIPWASEWLLHYEYWVVTREWRGGGNEH